MGLLTSIGNGVRGLLGDAASLDRLAQAQAFANGEPPAATRIGRGTRERRKSNPGADQLRAGGPAGFPPAIEDRPWTRPSDPGAVPPRIGQRPGRISDAAEKLLRTPIPRRKEWR